MAQVDPFLVPLPVKLATDPELGPWFTYLEKFCHDIWTRTGAGDDSVANSAQVDEAETVTGSWTFSGGVDLSGIALKVDTVQVVTSQQAAVDDAAAATAVNPAAPTGYTPHSSGAATVTSNAATDLDTTAAALDTLVAEVATYETAISALIVDVADIRTQLNSALAALRAHGLIAT